MAQSVYPLYEHPTAPDLTIKKARGSIATPTAFTNIVLP
jgi:hypothetical protein